MANVYSSRRKVNRDKSIMILRFFSLPGGILTVPDQVSDEELVLDPSHLTWSKGSPFGEELYRKDKYWTGHRWQDGRPQHSSFLSSEAMFAFDHAFSHCAFAAFGGSQSLSAAKTTEHLPSRLQVGIHGKYYQLCCRTIEAFIDASILYKRRELRRNQSGMVNESVFLIPYLTKIPHHSTKSTVITGNNT